ncbi:MAG: hypothetical protein HYV23_03965 [Deltaproteobacteria bacterium]|nr:hypothetical protein [Deltaproteobacteria bacterium]
MDEKITFKTLNLSEEERRHIEIRNNGVSLRVALDTIGLAAAEHLYSAHDKPQFESNTQSRFLMLMNKLWDEEVENGGGTLKARLNDPSEAEFFKEATTDEEVRSAVLSLVKLKRRFGIA